MAETPIAAGPARSWMKVTYGGYSHGKIIEFYAGGDTPDDVMEAFVHMFGAEAYNGATSKLMDILNGAQSTEGAISTVQGAGMVADGPRCKHFDKYGPRVRKTGTSKRGDWAGWFCPAPKGTPDQCSPEFE